MLRWKPDDCGSNPLCSQLYGQLLFDKYLEEEKKQKRLEEEKLERSLRFLEEMEKRENEQAERWLKHSQSFVSSMATHGTHSRPAGPPLRALKSMGDIPRTYGEGEEEEEVYEVTGEDPLA